MSRIRSESSPRPSQTVASGLLSVAVILIVGLACGAPNQKSVADRKDGGNDESPRNVIAEGEKSVAGSKKSIADSATKKADLEIVKHNWRRGGFDTVGIWTVRIRNNTTKQLGDIKYRTVYLSETGNVVSQ